MKVLIIEDNTEKRKAITQVLESTGHGKKLHYDCAVNISDASQKCRKKKYDLVVLDMRLPIAEGKEPSESAGVVFLNNLKNQRALKRPSRLVGLTAYSESLVRYKKVFEDDCYTLIQYDVSSMDWINQLSSVLAQASDAVVKSSEKERKCGSFLFKTLNLVVGIVALAVAVAAIFIPVALTPTSRTVLFFICACLCGLLFGSAVQSRFTFRLPGFCFTTVGAAAVFMGCIVLLHHLNTESVPLGVFRLRNSNGDPAEILLNNVTVELAGTGARAQLFAKGSELVILFPYGEESADVRISDINEQEIFIGSLRYTPRLIQEVRLIPKK